MSRIQVLKLNLLLTVARAAGVRGRVVVRVKAVVNTRAHLAHHQVKVLAVAKAALGVIKAVNRLTAVVSLMVLRAAKSRVPNTGLRKSGQPIRVLVGQMFPVSNSV